MSTELETIRTELLSLTALRFRVAKENDTVGRLFADLRQDKTPVPTWDELREAEEKVKLLVPGFYLYFSYDDNRYMLLPYTNKELADEHTRQE